MSQYNVGPAIINGQRYCSNHRSFTIAKGGKMKDRRWICEACLLAKKEMKK